MAVVGGYTAARLRERITDHRSRIITPVYMQNSMHLRSNFKANFFDIGEGPMTSDTPVETSRRVVLCCVVLCRVVCVFLFS